MTEDQRDQVCEKQSLNQKFISKIWNGLREYQRDQVCENQSLNQEFISKIWNGLREYQRDLIQAINLNFPHKKERIKRARDYATKHGLTIKGSFLYAFREHGNNGEGQFNPTTRYRSGESYRDWHCDPRQERDNSFGFGIWPKGNTPITVPLKDFVVETNRSDGKARVYAFTVLP